MVKLKVMSYLKLVNINIVITIQYNLDLLYNYNTIIADFINIGFQSTKTTA